MDKLKIGRLELEHDGSVVVCGEIVGKFEADCLTAGQTDDFNAELVRRWNLVEEKKLSAFGPNGKKVRVSVPE